MSVRSSTTGPRAEQVDALGKVISGEVGGPLAALGPLIGEFLGLEQAADQHHQRRPPPPRAGRRGDRLPGRAGPHPAGDLVELTNIEIHPAGPTLAVTTVEADNSPFGIRWSGQGLSGFANRFNWAAW